MSISVHSGLVVVHPQLSVDFRIDNRGPTNPKSEGEKWGSGQSSHWTRVSENDGITKSMEAWLFDKSKQDKI